MRPPDNRVIAAAAGPDGPSLRGRPGGALLCLVAVLILLFAPFLVALMRFAAAHALHSHILGVPAICAWLCWDRRERWPAVRPAALRPWWWGAPVVAVAAAAAAYATAGGGMSGAVSGDRLAVAMVLFVSALLAGAVLLLGVDCLRTFCFPALFLYAMVPLPGVAIHAASVLLQHLTVWVLDGLLRLVPVPVLRDGVFFHLPGFSLHVAEECSGIRSSLVLLLIAILAGMLLLRTPWRRLLLAAAVLPIAALRNALRILTLTLGTLYWDPDILQGPLHLQGGTPFFVLSLLPLFGTLIALRRGEKRAGRRGEAKEGVTGL